MTEKLCGFDFKVLDELCQEIENLAPHTSVNCNFIRDEMRMSPYFFT